MGTWKTEINVPDTIVIGVRLAKGTPAEKNEYKTAGMPGNVLSHALLLGLSSMARDSGADEKTLKGRVTASRAKWAAMLAGETGGRGPATPETQIMRLGVNMAAKALTAAGVNADAVKATTAAAMKAADPIDTIGTALAAARGLADAKPTVEKIRKAAKAAYDAANREI